MCSREPANRFAAWSDAEDAILRGLGSDPRERVAAARLLGRSQEAVAGRLAKLGLLVPRARSTRRPQT